MDIDMAALRALERDKEIPLDVLVAAIEEAMLSAYDRSAAPVPGSRVRLDRKTGKVSVLAPERDDDGAVIGEYDDTPEGFGRVAAATARQVIFQRLRSAEDDQKYGHFSAVEGDILTALRTATEGSTTVIVAHRRSSILLADRVVYLENGRVAASGRHDELMAGHPGYAALLSAYEVEEAEGAAPHAADADDGDDADASHAEAEGGRA